MRVGLYDLKQRDNPQKEGLAEGLQQFHLI
jgi:hypothetical protein